MADTLFADTEMPARMENYRRQFHSFVDRLTGLTDQERIDKKAEFDTEHNARVAQAAEFEQRRATYKTGSR